MRNLVPKVAVFDSLSWKRNELPGTHRHCPTRLSGNNDEESAQLLVITGQLRRNYNELGQWCRGENISQTQKALLASRPRVASIYINLAPCVPSRELELVKPPLSRRVDSPLLVFRQRGTRSLWRAAIALVGSVFECAFATILLETAFTPQSRCGRRPEMDH